MLVILLMPSCNYVYKNDFISDLSLLTTETVFNDNRCNLNNSANKICMYGEYYLKVCDNSTRSGNDICVIKTGKKEILSTYEIGEKIIGISPVDNKTLCYLTLDDTLSYYYLDLETNKTEKITPLIKNENSVLRVYPYFLNNMVYIAAVVGIEGQREPSLYIYNEDNNNYVQTAQYCTQFQFAENDLFFSTDNCKITKRDANGNEVFYDNNYLDKQTSMLVGNKIIRISEGVLEVINIETKKTETYAVGDIATQNTCLVYAAIYNNDLIYSDTNAVIILNLETSDIKKICDFSITSFSILNDSIFFEQNGELCELKIPSNNQNNRIMHNQGAQSGDSSVING